jgi:6,7-dimethyl-8-ribityllumazine synthase
MKCALVISQFNKEITDGLLKGALAYLKDQKEITSINSEQDIYYAPGAFEIPLIAQKLAESKKYDGIICLGCVIKGDTAHFEFISLGATIGLQMASLKTGVPITFGILTTYTTEQALVRSQENPENKGKEAAMACVESLRILHKI